MTTTTTYGTWCSRVDTYRSSPDSDVLDLISGGTPEWQTLLEESGALDLIKREYRDAINEALPPGVSLCGDEFIGPAHPDDGEFDGYPVDDRGDLDFKAMIEGIDLGAIVERHDPDNA